MIGITPSYTQNSNIGLKRQRQETDTEESNPIKKQKSRQPQAPRRRIVLPALLTLLGGAIVAGTGILTRNSAVKADTQACENLYNGSNDPEDQRSCSWLLGKEPGKELDTAIAPKRKEYDAKYNEFLQKKCKERHTGNIDHCVNAYKAVISSEVQSESKKSFFSLEEAETLLSNFSPTSQSKLNVLVDGGTPGERESLKNTYSNIGNIAKNAFYENNNNRDLELPQSYSSSAEHGEFCSRLAKFEGISLEDAAKQVPIKTEIPTSSSIPVTNSNTILSSTHKASALVPVLNPISSALTPSSTSTTSEQPLSQAQLLMLLLREIRTKKQH